MSIVVTRQSILSVKADAAVLCIENPMVPSDGAVNQALAQAGGEALLLALRSKRFLPVGRACAVESGALPFRHLLVTAVPRWCCGEANELTILRRCYASLYEKAGELGCQSLATGFLATFYYGFPKDEAVSVALTEAGKRDIETIFVAESDELAELSGSPYRKPRITAYLGWHRDQAAFLLEDGRYAKVDIRPEKREAHIHRFLEACYFDGRTAPPSPLPEEEIARLREIYESSEI